jgi:hypothetical protein
MHTAGGTQACQARANSGALFGTSREDGPRCARGAQLNLSFLLRFATALVRIDAELKRGSQCSNSYDRHLLPSARVYLMLSTRCSSGSTVCILLPLLQQWLPSASLRCLIVGKRPEPYECLQPIPLPSWLYHPRTGLHSVGRGRRRDHHPRALYSDTTASHSLTGHAATPAP